MSLNCMGEFRVHVEEHTRMMHMHTLSFCVSKRVLSPCPRLGLGPNLTPAP